jgi:hypothetical protein
MLTLHLLTVKHLLMGKIQGMLRWEYPVPSVKEATWTFLGESASPHFTGEQTRVWRLLKLPSTPKTVLHPPRLDGQRLASSG